MRTFSDVRFLIVEDSRFMRQLLLTIIKAMGARVVDTATDGKDALAKIHDNCPDLIVTDLRMPEMSGLEMIMHIRRSKTITNPFMPILVVSGYSDPATLQRARDVGASDFLRKPISASLLFKRIWRAIDDPRPFVRTQSFFGPDRRRVHERRHMEPDFPKKKDRRAVPRRAEDRGEDTLKPEPADSFKRVSGSGKETDFDVAWN